MKKKSYPSHKQVHLLGKVVLVDGKLKTKLNAPQYLEFFLAKHTQVGDEISVIVSSKRPKRSQRQHNFLFVYLDLISLSCGHTVNELYMWVKDKILAQGVTEVFGESVRTVLSESELNISEFCELMNRIYEETDIPIPDPKPFNVPLTYAEHGKLKLEQQEQYSKMQNRLITNKYHENTIHF